MAEDQGVNGTIWNKEAAKLLSYFGWVVRSVNPPDRSLYGSLH